MIGSRISVVFTLIVTPILLVGTGNAQRQTQPDEAPIRRMVSTAVDQVVGLFVGESVSNSQPPPKTIETPDGLLVLPTLIEYVTVDYPVEALESGVEGYVLLTLTVDENGEVVDTKVMESLGDVFDQAALDAARGMRAADEPAADGRIPRARHDAARMARTRVALRANHAGLGTSPTLNIPADNKTINSHRMGGSNTNATRWYSV